MSKIILQPVANKVAYEHYTKTLLNPVSIDMIKQHVDKLTYDHIQMQYPNGNVYVWGVKNGEKNVIKKKWERMERGDIALFARKGGIFASAIITIMFNSKSLALALWGSDKDNNTWENIYLVEEIHNINIPYKLLNSALGYKERYVVQGFNILNDEQSEKVGIKFELFSENICEEVREQDFKEFVVKLEDGNLLDVEGQTYRRKEQSFLRYYLFGRKSEAVCGICGRKLPVNMLTTSHIKKRSECSKEEKLDYKSIVMPMCKFGCDDLYEKGYIYIQDGQVKINDHKWATSDLKEELKKLNGRICEYYNEDTEQYFRAHRQKFGLL